MALAVLPLKDRCLFVIYFLALPSIYRDLTAPVGTLTKAKDLLLSIPASDKFLNALHTKGHKTACRSSVFAVR